MKITSVHVTLCLLGLTIMLIGCAKLSIHKEVRVSKFGFGPYPEIPADFPQQNIFYRAYYTDPNYRYKDEPGYELMDRLQIELWKRGVRGICGLAASPNGIIYVTLEDDIPADIKDLGLSIDLSEGIDVYKFLNLPRSNNGEIP